jgi:hypothetical protein
MYIKDFNKLFDFCFCKDRTEKTSVIPIDVFCLAVLANKSKSGFAKRKEINAAGNRYV